MNDSRYGLTASIWTDDVDAAIAIGDRVDTGTWFLNRCDYLDPALAWTGVKDSGRGVSLSTLGYESLTRPKSFHLRTWEHSRTRPSGCRSGWGGRGRASGVKSSCARVARQRCCSSGNSLPYDCVRRTRNSGGQSGTSGRRRNPEG